MHFSFIRAIKSDIYRCPQRDINVRDLRKVSSRSVTAYKFTTLFCGK